MLGRPPAPSTIPPSDDRGPGGISWSVGLPVAPPGRRECGMLDGAEEEAEGAAPEIGDVDMPVAVDIEVGQEPGLAGAQVVRA